MGESTAWEYMRREEMSPEFLLTYKNIMNFCLVTEDGCFAGFNKNPKPLSHILLTDILRSFQMAQRKGSLAAQDVLFNNYMENDKNAMTHDECDDYYNNVRARGVYDDV